MVSLPYHLLVEVGVVAFLRLKWPVHKSSSRPNRYIQADGTVSITSRLIKGVITHWGKGNSLSHLGGVSVYELRAPIEI